MSERMSADRELDDILREFSETEAAGGTQPAPAPRPVQRRADSARPQPRMPEAPAAPRRQAPPPPARPPRRPKGYEPVRAEAPGRVPVFSPGRVLLILLAALSLLWLLGRVHLDTGAVSAAQENRADLSHRVDSFISRAASGALENIAYVKPAYTIPEDALTAPRPDPAAFRYTDDPAEVQAAVDAAAELLAGQELIWSPEIERMEGTLIGYYRDESLLVICWKEAINGGACSFAEVKLAHGSQLRRAIAGGSYSSSVHLLASDMAKAANAVVAINGDFYDYRKLGITVYQRQVYRVVPAKVDTAYFTAAGDMLFSHKGELGGEGEAQRFAEENDVVFSVAFGPILVENGELRLTDDYPVGEVNSQYSRSVIAQRDKLHYLLMTMGQQGRYTRRSTINQTAQIIYDKGVQNAYTLDGGQTSTLVFNGTPFNRVDWDNERTMSDIIYFASAVPEEEVQP